MHAQAPFSPSFRVVSLGDSEALSLLTQAPAASWRQFPAYASIAAKVAGAENRYVLVSKDAMPVALANLRIKRLPVVPAGIAMIAQGPVMLVEDVPRAAVLTALHEEITQKQGLTLRINAPVTLGKIAQNSEKFSKIGASGYETFLIDINPAEEELRANLNGKWRTDLRRGERGDVQITRSSDPRDFRKFQPLLTELAQSKGFSPPQDADFFAQVAEHAAEHAATPENLTIHLAWHEDRLVGGHIGAFSGNMAVYLLGATTDEGRGLRASFLLQWAVIRFAKMCSALKSVWGGSIISARR